MIEALRLFGKELEGEKTISFQEVNQMSLEKGYLITPKACTEDVEKYISTISVNPNSTFYKTWNDIISKNRFELFIDQIKHYASTYGTDFKDSPYIPNNGENNAPDMTNIKVIDVISKEDLSQKCFNILYSGIALSQSTLSDIISILNKINIIPEIEKIKNKEAKMYICEKLYISPSNPEEFVRYLIYLSTNQTLLIKSNKVIKEIKNNNIDLSKYINNNNIKNISSVFYRYKPIFLAFKGKYNNSHIINKLRKLAIKNNKHKINSFWSNIFNKNSSYKEIINHLNELNNFKKVALINELSKREIESLQYKPYIIRNGKLHVEKLGGRKLNKGPKYLKEILYNSLIESLSKKKCTVKFPKDINITLPTSEKSFIGNYPLYTNINIDKNMICGIYWKNIWGADDFDLSLIDTEGLKIGWDSNYENSDKVIFSGDMTSANPEATELLYFPEGYRGNGLINVNLYQGKINSELNFFIAKEKTTLDKISLNYMVNPNDIILSNHIITNNKESIFGVIANHKFYFTCINNGSNKVSRGDEKSREYINYIINTKGSYLSLKNVLLEAGFVESENPDIDFTEMDKDKLISLMS